MPNEPDPKSQLPNFIAASSNSTVRLHFPAKLKDAVHEIYQMAIKERKVPAWHVASYLDTVPPSKKNETERSTTADLSLIDMSSPLRGSAGFVIESAKVYVDTFRGKAHERRFTVLCFSFLKELFGTILNLGIAATPEEHDYLASQHRAVMSTAKKNPLKEFSDTQLLFEHIRKQGAPCRQSLTYLFCFLPAEYFLRFLTMLPRLMSQYASLYRGYVNGALTEFSAVVDLILAFLNENVQFGTPTEYYRIPNENS
mmetsp:Transcript_33925/g.53084  ORF Transcript_33925/g.53084 Transcript_33925/m.53084 type:complete len:255 (-) Transcript_33925:40-804(-)